MARDTLRDEPRGMRAYRGASGEVLWHDKSATGPAMIRGATVLKEKTAADLLTGKAVRVADPVTGILGEWSWTRMYGCNTPAVSEHLLTFRSGAAGFYDLARCGGTGTSTPGARRSAGRLAAMWAAISAATGSAARNFSAATSSRAMPS